MQLSSEERQSLESMARKYTSPYCDVIRAKIILLADDGLPNDLIAAKLDTPRQIVSKWRKRFAEERMPGLAERVRGSRKRGARRPRRASSSRRRSTSWAAWRLEASKSSTSASSPPTPSAMPPWREEVSIAMEIGPAIDEQCSSRCDRPTVARNGRGIGIPTDGMFGKLRCREPHDFREAGL